MTELGGDEAAGERSQPRDSMLLHATVRRAGADETDAETGAPIRIRNLSAGGLMGEADLALARGEHVEVMLRNVGAVPGIVAWSVDGKVGIAFTTPVDRLRVRRAVTINPDRPTPMTPQSRRPGLRTG